MGLSGRKYAAHRKTTGLPGGTVRAVQEALSAGRIQLEPDGSIDPARADRAWAANTLDEHRVAAEVVAVKVEAVEGESRAEALRRRSIAVANLAELDFGARSGGLTPTADVRRATLDVFGEVRTKILGVVDQIRQRDPTITPEQTSLVTLLLREALAALAADDRVPAHGH